MKKILFSLLALVVCTTCVLAQGCVAPTSTSTITLKRIPPGLLEGNFTINASGDKVQFAGGNLQYNSDTQRWQFAEHQYDYIGNAAGNTSVTTAGIANGNGIVDLFGWVGASSSWTGLKQYGISSSQTYGAVDGYGTSAYEALKSDWGTLAIYNGGNEANSGWRSLTMAEWSYIIQTRNASTVNGTSNCRYAKATINTDGTSVKGMILFPDGGTFASSEFTDVGSPNSSNVDYTTTCTTAQWTALEAKGCVFLPAAGYRKGATWYNDYNYYWSLSSTSYNSDAYNVRFSSTSISISNNGIRPYGAAIRLVQDVE